LKTPKILGQVQANLSLTPLDKKLKKQGKGIK